MPVAINEMTIEPATTPKEQAGAPATEGSKKSGPEVEREVQKIVLMAHDRKLRLWAH